MTISEYRAAVKRCCGEKAGKQFCETFGCGNVQELLRIIDEQLAALERIRGGCALSSYQGIVEWMQSEADEALGFPRRDGRKYERQGPIGQTPPQGFDERDAEIARLKDLCQYEGTCLACGGPTRYYPRCDKCAAEQPK